MTFRAVLSDGEKWIQVWGEGAHRGLLLQLIPESGWLDFMVAFAEAVKEGDRIAQEKRDFEQRDKTEV